MNGNMDAKLGSGLSVQIRSTKINLGVLNEWRMKQRKERMSVGEKRYFRDYERPE